MSIYTPYFQFNAQPFSITPDPRFLYSSALHQEGLAHLSYGIQGNGGFVALTGEVGTGKTLLCHCLLQHLPENVDIALILNPRLDAVELLASICDELGIYYPETEKSLKYLNDALNRYLLIAHSRGRNTVLMIDEAQNLSLEVLEQVRLLTNLETPTEKLLQIILVGQPELQVLLERPDLRQLNQRITARFHLQALDAMDSQKYIQHRLAVCKGQASIFSIDAIKQIFKYSAGVPRVINVLCDRCLLGAYTLEKHQVDAAIVRQAASELQLTSSNLAPKGWTWPVLWLFLVCGIVLGTNAGFRQKLVAWYMQARQATQLVQQVTDVTATTPPEAVADSKPKVTDMSPLIQSNDFQYDKHAAGNTSLTQLLQNKSLTLTTALKLGARALNKSLPASAFFNCDAVERYGIHCLRDRSSLTKLFSYQRPVILEFDIPSKRKMYVLLKSSENGKVILQADTEIVLDLGDMLSAWNGNYIILWESPFSGSKEITPGENSQAVSWLRELVAQPATDNKDRFFDNALRDKIIAFQSQHNLLADGVAGGRTLILLQNEKQAMAANSLHPEKK